MPWAQQEEAKSFHSKTNSGFTVSFRAQSDLQSTYVFFKIINENQAQHRMLLRSLCHGNTDATGSRYLDTTLSCEPSLAVASLLFCSGFSVENVSLGLVTLALAILWVCCCLVFLSLDNKIQC